MNEKKQREEINRQEIIRMEQERIQSLMEQINKKKKSMQTIFDVTVVTMCVHLL